MKQTQRLLLLICIFGLFLLFAATTIGRAQSGSYFLSWFSFSGGGQISGNGYTLSSVIGQPLNGTQNGGGYSLQIGSVVLTGTLNPTPTFTATPSPTPTFTATPSSTSTFTPTPSPTITATRTQNDLGDSFEPDNSCGSAQMINNDGTLQEHTFHQAGDVDWLRFETEKDTGYRLEVSVPPGSHTDVVVTERVAECNGSPVGEGWDNPDTLGVRLTFTSTVSGAYYLKLTNHDSSSGDTNFRYAVSLQKLEPQGKGGLIIVEGKYKNNDPVQNNILRVAEKVYFLFQNSSYSNEDIY